ncbi:MAG: hypothetical protein ACE5MI_04150 [Acidimicrobiia bacterium]
MSRAPLVTGILVMASATYWSLLFTFAPSPMDRGAATLLALDLLAVATVSVAGIVIPRSVWARRLAIGVVTAPVAGLFALGLGWATGSATVLSGIALLSLVGPWLGTYIGSLPRSTAPPAAAVVLALALLIEPGWIALASYQGLSPGLWALAVACFLLAWTYGRALRPALMFLRFGLLPATLVAVLASPLLVAAAASAYSAGAMGLAWTRDARRAVAPPEAVTGTVVPIPITRLPEDVRRSRS